MNYLVKTQEQMKMLLDKDMLTIKALEEENLKLKATCSDLHVQITKGLKKQIKQREWTLVGYEAKEKSRDYLKLMTESTHKASSPLETVKKEMTCSKPRSMSSSTSSRIRLPLSKRRYDVVCALHFIVLYV
jgi:RNase P subunit RPR2